MDGKIYTLYLRWRWEDPWQFNIIKGDAVSNKGIYVIDVATGRANRVVGITKEGELRTEPIEWKFITVDLFIKHNIFFKEDKVKDAEKKAEEIFLRLIEKEKH